MAQDTTLSLVLKNDVITGFSYSFSSALLRKLKEMNEKDQIFKKGLKNALNDAKKNIQSYLTDMAIIVAVHLHQQISVSSDILDLSTKNFPEEVNQFISFVEEFLAIFQE
ncbi:MAG TPA: hypothetical protein VMD74_02960 [Candidatus Methylomirabilis sp.]|nr:hypothetical protein [Candidatus Methylomirabilis sp.]